MSPDYSFNCIKPFAGLHWGRGIDEIQSKRHRGKHRIANANKTKWRWAVSHPC